MNNFQSLLAFCAFITIIFMMFPYRANLASKPIIAILKLLPMNLLAKMVDGISKKIKK